MRRLILVFAIILLTFPIRSALAQPTLEFEKVTVEIWPEYDNIASPILVIYRLTLTAQTSMPAQVSLRIPKEAGQPYNVAYVDVDNVLYTVPFTTAVEGDWLRMIFTSPSPNIQVEYYDPRLTKNGDRKSFQYHWAGDYKVRSMTFRVQQPPKASQMTITPTQGTQSQAQDGLTYFTSDVGQVEASTPFAFQVEYTKPNDILTIDGLPLGAGGNVTPIPAPVSSQGGPLQGLNSSWIFLAFGVVLVGGGLVWFFIQRRLAGQAASNTRRHGGSATNARRMVVDAAEPSGGSGVYCHQCGKKAQSGDMFCRACGTKLRVE